MEADETYIGGYRPGLNGRGVGKTGVAITVERREKTVGSVRLAVIPRATRAVLTSFVQGSITDLLPPRAPGGKGKGPGAG